MKNQPKQITASQPSSEEKRARARLLRLLARRPHTIQEAARKLQTAGYSKLVVERVIEEAQRNGWLDDQTYAKLWVEDRTASKPRGKALLKRELRRKGIADQKIERAISDADLNEEDLVLRLAHEQVIRYQIDDPQKLERKLKNFLLRRGFSFDAIRRALKQIGEPDAQKM